MPDPLRNWDRQLEQALPECRLSGMAREHTQIQLGRMWAERVFCANCGAPGGAVTPPEWAAHVFYICNDCAGLHGAAPLPEIDEAMLSQHVIG